MRDFLQLDDEELLAVLTDIFLQQNPRVKVGERMSGPVAVVWKGKMVYHTSALDQDVISFDYTVPHIEPEQQVIKAVTLPVHFEKLEGLELNDPSFKFMYPYSARIPHREWLAKHKVGDTVMVVDDTFSASPVVLTEKHFHEHSYIIFRYGVSD